jgi:hypothetical protein
MQAFSYASIQLRKHLEHTVYLSGESPMFRQFASLAALAIVAAPMLPLAQSPAMAGQPKHSQDKKCVQVRLDSYNYRGEIQEQGTYWDKFYFDWHVDCYNQDRPPYEVEVTSYYGQESYSESYRGKDSDYVLKVRIKVVGNQGTYEYYSPRLTF